MFEDRMGELTVLGDRIKAQSVAVNQVYTEAKTIAAEGEQSKQDGAQVCAI